MSEQNVELVRRALEAYRGRDVEALLSYLDPEVTFTSAIVGPAEGNVHRGHAEVREWHADSLESFEELELFLEEFHDLGERVLAFGHIHARGRESGLELNSPTGWVFVVRRVVIDMQGFLDPQQAVEAAGMTPDDLRSHASDERAP